MDVIESLCLGQVCTLTQCDFTYEEAALLFEVNKAVKGARADYAGMATMLYHWSGMTREDMAAFRWRLKDWHAAGLSLEQIKQMAIDDDFACTYLNWTPIEFNAFYRVPITELVPKQPQPEQPQLAYPIQPSPAAVSAAAASPIAPRPAPPPVVQQPPQPQPRYMPPQQQQMYATARGAAPPMPRAQPPGGTPLSGPQRPTTLSSAPMRRILTPQQPLSSAPRLGPNNFSTGAGGGLPGY
jgi:hypothetical protein